MAANPYESPHEVQIPEGSGRSDWRSGCGWILLLLGTLLPLRMMWLGFAWWPLREETLNRFVIGTGFFVTLGILGCWLILRSNRLLIAAIVFAAVYVLLLPWIFALFH